MIVPFDTEHKPKEIKLSDEDKKIITCRYLSSLGKGYMNNLKLGIPN